MKFLTFIKAAAKASPITKVAVVEDIGASCKGQASFFTAIFKNISLCFTRVEFFLPHITISGILRFFIAGMIFKISSVSPEFEIAIKTSSGVSIPRSPCKASPGWMKKLGVPVLAKVAAILAPI